MWLLLVLACMDCVEIDPGAGCDPIHLCCNDAGTRCEYRTYVGDVYECEGGQASCGAAARDVMCDICISEGAEDLRDSLEC